MLNQYVPDFLSKVKVASGTIDVIMSDINSRYSEKGRFYHTLTHIDDFLKILNGYENRIHNRESMTFACIYHDIIYDTTKIDNEEKSSDYAGGVLSNLKFSENLILMTKKLIISTKNHIPSDDTFDSKIFLDGDLSILGTDKEKYSLYSRSIRNEYSWLCDEDYHKGRKNILEKFLGRERIFYTDEFYELYEKKARNNIMNEIQKYVS